MSAESDLVAPAAKDFASTAILRLLRSTQTGQYWKKNGWTAKPREAAIFRDEIAAVRVCLYPQLQNIKLVLVSLPDHTEVFSTKIR